jgi:predicted membrane-bound spermidine synthase
VSRKSQRRGLKAPLASPRGVEAGPARRALWLSAALLAGGIAMSLEIAAARLLAPYLGSSLQVWGSLISVILGAMALGYAVGGRIADRWPGDVFLFGAIAASGLYQTGALFLAHPLLRRLAPWPETEAALAAIALLFGVPTLLLAAVGPCVIRLSARDGVGTTAGAVFALGTIGSIAGVLLTSFVLLPHAGTRATQQGLAALSLTLGAIGLLPRRVSVAGLAILALAFAPEREWPTGTVWAGESIYHVVQVVERGPLRGLVLDQEQSLHTAVDREGGRTHGYWDDFAVGPIVARGHRVLVLGMGGGASVRAVRLADSRATIDAVEIDPVVVQAAVSRFGIEPGPELRVHQGDARRFLAASRETYDVIQMDLFRGGPEIPSHLATREFYQLARGRLNHGGVLMVNVFDIAPAHDLLASITASLSQPFSTIFVRSRNQMNHMILAFAEPRSLSEVRRDLEAAPSSVSDVAGEVSRELRPVSPDRGGIVLTDDRAPVEELTREMMAAARTEGLLPQR